MVAIGQKGEMGRRDGLLVFIDTFLFIVYK
jgi:hypothetical protein